jgi:hypothetical protein
VPSCQSPVYDISAGQYCRTHTGARAGDHANICLVAAKGHSPRKHLSVLRRCAVFETGVTPVGGEQIPNSLPAFENAGRRQREKSRATAVNWKLSAQRRKFSPGLVAEHPSDFSASVCTIYNDSAANKPRSGRRSLRRRAFFPKRHNLSVVKRRCAVRSARTHLLGRVFARCAGEHLFDARIHAIGFVLHVFRVHRFGNAV